VRSFDSEFSRVFNAFLYSQRVTSRPENRRGNNPHVKKLLTKRKESGLLRINRLSESGAFNGRFIMRKLIIGLVGCTALALASAANADSCGASCSYTSTPGSATYTGPTPTYDFDSPATTPVTTGGSITNQNIWSFSSLPLGASGMYYAVGPAPGSPDGSTFSGSIDLSTFAAIQSIGVIWGSADTYNTLDILDRMGHVIGTISGSVFNGGVGSTTDPNSNPIVTLNFDSSIQDNIGGLKLISQYNAFEVDNFVIGAVPEPATWALMLLGFGGIGLAMRRRRKPALAQLA
jgi:hypothetical protein